MKITEADVIWTPAANSVYGQVNGEEAELPGEVRVEKHLSGWQRTRCDMWMPAATAWNFHQPKHPKAIQTQLLSMFILFHTITVRDEIDPAVAHAAFLEIDEYRMTISPDAEGAGGGHE